MLLVRSAMRFTEDRFRANADFERRMEGLPVKKLRISKWLEYLTMRIAFETPLDETSGKESLLRNRIQCMEFQLFVPHWVHIVFCQFCAVKLLDT